MIHKVGLLFTLLVAAANGFVEQDYRTAFTQWMQKHSKSYTNVEFNSRYQTFKGNMDYVYKWNLANEDTKLELNYLADLSNAEYQSIYLGTKINKPTVEFEKAVENVNIPASVDWRQSGAVTAIKNQGQCGSCWSFSTTGSTEGINKISGNQLVSLSEQNLMDCSTSYGNNGCNGGLMDNAFKYIIANNGIDTEASYPYQGVQGTCKFNSANVGATISGYTDVQSGSESALQTAAAQQPVSVAIDASHTSFQLYSSGVYYEPACSSTQLDHGVLVAGYGTSGSTPYWLVKNSWGTTWGQQGYIWMSRNRNNNCGIATTASYPTKSGSSSNGNSNTNGNGNTSATNGNGNTSATNGDGNTSATNGNGDTSASLANGNGNTSSTNGDGSTSASTGNGNSATNGNGNTAASNGSSNGNGNSGGSGGNTASSSTASSGTTNNLFA